MLKFRLNTAQPIVNRANSKASVRVIFAVVALGFAISAAHSERIGAAKPAVTGRALPAPASWQTRRDYSKVPISTRVALPTLTDMETAAALEAASPGTPRRYGIGRELPEVYRGNVAQTAQWAQLPNGAWVASFSIRSPGAEALRLGLRATLPEGAIVRFFRPGVGGSRYPVFKQGDFAGGAGSGQADPALAAPASRLRWSPTIHGDAVGIEIEIPHTASPAEVEFGIARASHIWALPTTTPPTAKHSPVTTVECGPRPVDVACKSTPSCPRGAVASISFTDMDGGSYVCTGTAIKSGRSAFDNRDNPFFLTSQHCIESQGVAESVEASWHYEHQNCDGTGLDPAYVERRGGADLLVDDRDVDISLLRLRDALPASACLADWSAADDLLTNTPVVSFHHPGGRPKEWASGIAGRTSVLLVDEGRVGLDTIRVVWTDGRKLPGSSGSGLFRTNVNGVDELIGVYSRRLAGSCSVGFYGRFDRFFANRAQAHLGPTTALPGDDHGGSASDATGVLLNSEVGGSIDDGADADVFRIDVPAFGRLTVYTTSPFDTYGRLKRPDGTSIAEGDDEGQNGNFRIVAALDPGTYYVKVTGYDHTHRGDYRLHVKFEASAAPTVLVPLFLAASEYADAGREGVVRIANRSNRSGKVGITAVDDEGATARDVDGNAANLTLDIKAYETRGFNSRDFEAVDAFKGLSGAVRLLPGTGHWRLRLESNLDIEVAAYIRTRHGLLASVHDMVIFEDRTNAYPVHSFNPASNTNQRSRLRLINGDANRFLNVTINGFDDAGIAGDSSVALRLAPGAARSLDANELETGGDDISGRLGDGWGKWRLFIEADGNLTVLNLLESANGGITNLSSAGGNNYK